MAGGSRVEQYPAPVGGMEWREGYQEKKHAEVLVNVDLSVGTLRGRRGVEYVGTSPLNGSLHVSEDPFGRRIILSLGARTETDHDVEIKMFDQWGSQVGVQNLTATLGEPQQRWVRCSFVNTTLTSKDYRARFVTLIVTRYNVYVFDPEVALDEVRLLNMSEFPTGDQLRSSKAAYAYLSSTLGGGIAAEHKGVVFYAGFAKNTEMHYSDSFEEDQTAIPEQVISESRQFITVGPHVCMYGSGFDGAADVIDIAFFGLEDQERIMGMKSFQQALTVFTDKSIYVVSGAGSGYEGFSATRVDSGQGCAAHRSIVEVGGVLYYMSHGGVFAYGGLASPHAIKISSPLDALWQGRAKDHWLPAEMESLLRDEMGWPWQVDHGRLEESCGVHIPHLSQIWWSVPIRSKGAFDPGLTLVFDYVRTAWTVYVRRDNDTGYAPFMADGVVIDEDAEAVVFTSGRISLLRYGSAIDEDRTSSRGIPVVWLSCQLNSSGAAAERVKDVRFRVLSNGKIPSTSPPRVVISGDEAHADVHQTKRQEIGADLSLYPDESLGTFFLGEMKLDDGDGLSKFAEPDWFLSKFNARVSSAAWRVGIVDDANAQEREPRVEMRNFVAEIKTLGTE